MHASPLGLRLPRIVAFIVALASGATALLAQTAPATGDVSGVVSNRFTGEVLAGARIRVEGTAQQAVSDELGRFRLANVPAGAQAVTASYTGLETVQASVDVVAGQTALLRLELDSEVVQLAEFVVRSEIEGNAAAIQSQKNAQNVKNVLSLDALGILPNDNAGELLVRMPGVAPRLDEEGSVTGVSIRGFQPGDNAVAVDGDKMTSSGGLNRDFRMNSISGGLFEEIEVTKAPTPDMDAESLGGAVNFKSRSPLSMKEDHRFDYRISAKWFPNFVDRTPLAAKHPLHGLVNLGYQGVYDVLGGRRNLGVALKVFHSENANSAYSVQNYLSYASSTAALPNRAITDEPFYWQNTYPYEVRIRDLYNNRKQTSLNLRTEYKFSDQTRIWMTGIVNDAIESGQHIYQQRFFFSRQTETYNPDGTIANWGVRLATGEPFSSDYVNLRSGARHQINTTINTFEQRDRRLQLGGEHRTGNLLFTGGLNYSKTKVTMNDTPGTGTGVTFTELKSAGSTSLTAGHAYTYDGRLDPTMPIIVQTRGTDWTDINNYGGSAGTTSGNLDTRLHYRSRQNRRDTSLASGNADVSFALNTSVPVMIKTGVSGREQEFDSPFSGRDYYLANYNAGTSLAKFQDPNVQTFWGQQNFQVPFLSVGSVVSDLVANPSDWAEDLDYAYIQRYANTKNVKERVNAGYVQATIATAKVQTLIGLRVEKTRTDGFGYLMDPSAPDLSYSTNIAALESKYNNPTRQVNSYTNYFPGVHFKYEPVDRLILRASFSTSIGRPNLNDVAPGLSVGNSSDGTYTSFISMNNPDLEAQYSRNFDLTAEYYYKPYGVVSFGVFRKNIRDFIYTEDNGNAGDVLGGAYDGVRLRRKYNGASATVEGFEFGYQHQLRFLPGILRGLSLYANYTYLETEGDYDNGDSGEVADFVPRSGNAGLKFRYRKLTLDVNANYNGDYLDTYQTAPSRRIYRRARTVTNATVSYRVLRNTTVFVNINNLFNEPQEWFQKGAEGERFNRYIYNATSMTFGVSGRF